MNQQRLGATLASLGSLRAEVVLLGGASTQLLITDPAASGERPTDDVDFIVDCNVPGLYEIESRLRNSLGFTQRPDLHDPMFVATKLDAFDDRGHGDHHASRDLEDVIAVVDGRAELVDEVAAAPSEVRAYLAGRVDQLLAEPDFVDAVAGHLAGDEDRLPVVIDRLRQLVVRARSGTAVE